MKTTRLAVLISATLGSLFVFSCIDQITGTVRLDLPDCPVPWPVFSAADTIPGSFNIACPYWWITSTGDTVANIFGRIPEV